MVPKQNFINKLRELGYYYKSTQKRTELWRKKGGTHHLFIPFNTALDEETAASLLNQAGCLAPDIAAFISATKTKP